MSQAAAGGNANPPTIHTQSNPDKPRPSKATGAAHDALVITKEQ